MRSINASWQALLLAAVVFVPPLSRGQTHVSEAELKAALVFNFARYIEWPERAFASREAPLVLCLVGGRERLGAAFASLEGRRLQTRSVKVRVGVATDEVRGCHVVFLADLAERQLTPLLRSLSAQPVLTVSDAEDFIDSGGAIGIVQGDQRLQFEVNRNSLEQAQLSASSQLLKLARAVIGQGG